MIGRSRQFSEPRLRQQARITKKSQTLVERDILGQWVRRFVAKGYVICANNQISVSNS